MINSLLLQEKNSIDILLYRIKYFTGNPYDKALLTYYLCIRISGFIENCVRIIFSNYSQPPRSKDSVETFIMNKLKILPNLHFGKILGLISCFNNQWAKRLKSQISKNEIASLESIILNRNNLAHGGTSPLTLTDLEQYYLDVLSLLTKLESIVI